MVHVTLSRDIMDGPSKSEKKVCYPYLFKQKYSLSLSKTS
jgi:hypothetical protein